MASTSLPPEIRQLPVPDRLDLVERIRDSIVEDEAAVELSDAQKAELDRRIAAHEAEPARGSSWEDVRTRIAGD